MWKKLKYIFRPSWPLERSRWLNLTIPFFSVKIYFKSIVIPYVYILIVFILAWKYI